MHGYQEDRTIDITEEDAASSSQLVDSAMTVADTGTEEYNHCEEGNRSGESGLKQDSDDHKACGGASIAATVHLRVAVA